MSELRQFNLNDAVLIKISEHGLEIMRRRHEELRREAPSIAPWEPPEVDADGYTRMQLWCVMQEFGPSIGMGLTVPFETTILFPVKGT